MVRRVGVIQKRFEKRGAAPLAPPHNLPMVKINIVSH